MSKKILSVILSLIIVLCTMPIVFAQESQTSLYNVYADGMLFAQNKEAVFSGTSAYNTMIKAELFDSENTLIASAENATAQNGEFEVSFIAPAGGYKEYTVVLSADGVEFDRLENVVFGELWLASGQSNMQYSLYDTPDGKKMFEEGKKLSKWIRALIVPAPKVTNNVPVDTQNNITNVRWVSGENISIYEMSGVGYYFAEDLMKKLDMPVGVLSSSVGGSTIVSWISRDCIDNDAEASEILRSKDVYYEEATWNENERNILYDMTGNYNTRIHPLRSFRPSGAIWYQGESDLILRYTPEQYTVLFNLLQECFSSTFGYDNEMIPMVYTQLASYMYSKTGGFQLPEWNQNYIDIQNAMPDSRAVITISDVPLTYIPKSGFIHPESKAPVGQRMSYAAQGLVYGADYDYSAPYMDSFEIKGSEVYLKFKNVGDGLTAKGDEIIGFTICGANRIYTPAEAEIIDAETIKVYSPAVIKPASVTYAYSPKNDRSNIFATDNGQTTMPLSCFLTKEMHKPHYWVDKPWADCEEGTHFQNYDSYRAGMYPTWESKDCEIDFNEKSAVKGKNGLNIISAEKKFSVNNAMSYFDELETRNFYEIDSDYSDYKTMSFYIKNNGSAPVTISSVRFYSEAVLWYAAEVQGTGKTDITVPADGEWHLVTLDLNSLYLMNDEKGFIYSNNLLDEVKKIQLTFEADGNADISVDEFNFGIEGNDVVVQLNPDYSLFGSIAAFLKGFFPTFGEWLVAIIKTLI